MNVIHDEINDEYDDWYIYVYRYVCWEMWIVIYIDWYEIDLRWDMNLYMDEMCILLVMWYLNLPDEKCGLLYMLMDM